MGRYARVPGISSPRLKARSDLLTRLRLLLPLTIVTLLAACDSKPATDAAKDTGEVLQGTISDAMLPLDTVKSQPPLAEPATAARGSASGAADDEVAETADEEGAAPEEAATAPDAGDE
jgi:hypothetical protein